MEGYNFKETSSSTFTDSSERFRKVHFIGEDIQDPRQLNITGYIPKVPEVDYFRAGLEGTLDDLIRNHVVARIMGNTEGTENAE